MREKTDGQSLPDIESMASANECTGSLPALPAEGKKADGPRARLKQRAAKMKR